MMRAIDPNVDAPNSDEPEVSARATSSSSRGHQRRAKLIMEADDPCRFVVASTLVYPEVGMYPDSGKVTVCGAGRRGVYRRSSKVAYLDGDDRRSPR